MTDDKVGLALYMGRLDKHIEYLKGLSEKINRNDTPIDEDTKKYLLLGINNAVLTMADVLSVITRNHP